MYVEIRTTIKGGLPVWASGLYRAADAGYPHGQWARPPEPAHIEDLEIYFLKSRHRFPMQTLSEKELERVERELIDFVKRGDM